MSSERQNQDQRNSFRCMVVDARRRCELKVGSSVLPAMLLNESAGGFAVLVDRLAGLSIDQTAQLHTDAGWFEVLVVHVAEVDPTEDDGIAAGEQNSWFRLGLSRLGEAALPDQPAVSLLAGSLRFHLGQWYPSGGMLTILGVLLAVVAVAAPVALMNMHWHAGPSGVAWLLQWSNRSIVASKARHSAPLPGLARPAADDSPFSSGPAFDDGNSVFDPDSGQVRKSRQSSLSSQGPHDSIRLLPGAAAMALPEIVEQLQLTTDQQEQIRQLIEATSQAMRNLDAQLQGRQRQQISEFRTQLLDESRRKALELLTGQQRVQWEKLTGKQ